MNSKNLPKPRDSVTEIEDLKILQKLLQNKKPLTWVFVGDSITHGSLHTNGQRSFPEHFAERVRCELKRYSDIVINTGVTNDTTNILLRTWEARVARFKPDVVSIMEGMNDCYDGVICSVIEGMNDCNEATTKEKFANNLYEIVSRVRQIGAIPLLHSMNTINLATDLQRKNLPMYVDVIRSIVREQRVIFVDNYKYWEANSNTSKWLNDSIHPNSIGHRAIVNEVFRMLGIFDDKSPTCRN